MPVEKINEKTEQLLNKFLEENIYPRVLDKDNLLAVIAYGSSLTGYASKNSDIDLMIILNESVKTTRGVKIFKSQKIEYFIKSLEKFMTESDYYAFSNCPSRVALAQNAYFLYDRHDLIKNFLNSEIEYYNENRQRPYENNLLKIVQIENRIASLQNIFERNGKEFNMVYYNILEMIRSLHMKNSDEADVPFAKAYRVYTEPEYYDKYISNKASNPLPDKDFVALYCKCVEEANSKEEMLNNLLNLYNYEKQNYNIDPENYELNLN